MASLSVSVLGIIVLMVGAVTLGFTIHFFIVSRRTYRINPTEGDKLSRSLEQWKLRYFNDIETRDKEIADLKKKADDITRESHHHSDETDDLKRQVRKLQQELEQARHHQEAPGEKPDYIAQLRQAQLSLMDQHAKINQLLAQIDIVSENESQKQEIQKYNDELSSQVDDLRSLLSEKEKEVNEVKQKAHLTREMSSMLDTAYNEFGALQDKIHKLESQVNASKRLNLEYEDLKEGHFKISREYDELKSKFNVLHADNQQLNLELRETEEKLREANFQRQQLQKKVVYLEELNNDMQAVADANKKLENQLRRIGELESMLNVVSEERDNLAKKQAHS